MTADQSKLFPGTVFISTVLDAADTKASMTQSITRVYLMRAAMAGFLIGLFYLANYAVIAAISGVSEHAYDVGRFIGAMVFGFALAFIYYTKSELLTSNMMITTIALYYKRMKLSRAATILLLCFFGNLLGGLFIALLVSGSSLLDGSVWTFVEHTVETKLSYVTSGASGMLDLFIRAIFCNFLINVSMLMTYNGLVKSDGVKVAVMHVAVVLFAFLGFEHSVANSVLFLVEGFHNGIDVLAALGNVGIALLGNYVGGGLLIGWYYAYANDPSHGLANSGVTLAGDNTK